MASPHQCLSERTSAQKVSVEPLTKRNCRTRDVVSFRSARARQSAGALSTVTVLPRTATPQARRSQSWLLAPLFYDRGLNCKTQRVAVESWICHGECEQSSSIRKERLTGC